MQLSDVLIHINDDIDESRKEYLVNNLRDIEGVIAPRFNDDKKHLLLVAYDPDTTCSLALLNAVKDKGYKAQLLGL